MKKNKLYKIVFENDDFLLADKSAGLVVIPDRFLAEPYNLKELLEKETGGELLLIHRIDKDTSGLILFAKNSKTQKYFHKIFSERKIEKKYLTIVDGFFGHKELTTNYPILELNNGKSKVDDKGKECLTEFTLKEGFRDYALLEANLKTGRTHQIRVHLSFIGTPILSDPLYGTKRQLFLSKLKGRKYNATKNKVERPLINRTALHSHSLSFVDNKGISHSFQAELPKDMRSVINQLRKFNAKIFF